MPAPQTLRIENFAGEDRERPQFGMPLNISPDAENVDYHRGTLKTAEGFVHRNTTPLHGSGIYIKNWDRFTADRSYAQIAHSAVFNFATEWEMHLAVLPLAYDDGATIIQKWNGGANDGFDLSIQSNKLQLRVRHSGGTETVTGTDTIAAGTVEYIRFGYYDSGGGTYKAFIRLPYGADILDVSTGSVNTWGTNSENILIGSNHSASQNIEIVVAEFRAYASYLASTFFDLRVARTVAIDPATTVAYYDGSIVDGGLTIQGTVNPSFIEGSIVTPLTGSSLNRPAVHLAQIGGICGITPYYETDGDSTKLMLMTRKGAVWKMGTDGVVAFQYAHAAQPTRKQWAYTHIANKLIMCASDQNPLKYDGTLCDTMVYEEVDETAITVGYSAGVLTGVFKYIFRYRRDGDGTVSENSGVITTKSMSSEEVDFSTIPLAPDLNVDKIEIFRTKAGAATYYYLTEIAHDAASYTDNAADSTLVTLMDLRVGNPQPAVACLVHDTRLWLLGVKDDESRVVYSDTVDDDDPAGWSKFHSNNYIDVGNGDGDRITGGISLYGEILVTKERSLWRIIGGGPTLYSAQKIWEGEGCISNATLALGLGGVYFLGMAGIMRLPIPLGSGPPANLTEDRLRGLLAVFPKTVLMDMCGGYDSVKNQYRISLSHAGVTNTPLVSLRGEASLVYTEKTGAIALHSIDFDHYHMARFPDDRQSQSLRLNLLAAYRGHLVEIDGYVTTAKGPTWGGEVIGTNGTVTGPVVSAATAYIEVASISGRQFEQLYLSVESAAGAFETHPIWFIDATNNRIYINGFTVTPDSTFSYHIGPIPLRWAMPKALMGGSLQNKANLRHLAMRMKTTGFASVANCAVSVDENAAITYTFAADASNDKIRDAALQDAGHEATFVLTNERSDQPIEIEAIDVTYEPLVLTT